MQIYIYVYIYSAPSGSTSSSRVLSLWFGIGDLGFRDQGLAALRGRIRTRRQIKKEGRHCF